MGFDAATALFETYVPEASRVRPNNAGFAGYMEGARLHGHAQAAGCTKQNGHQRLKRETKHRHNKDKTDTQQKNEEDKSKENAQAAVHFEPQLCGSLRVQRKGTLKVMFLPAGDALDHAGKDATWTKL
eukprot:1008729-Alexandrium_andersonii.AAC.1